MTVFLASLQRRQGLSFQLKTARNEVIGTMVLNPAKAQHEMELSEEDFLRHSKELARLASIPGMGWYVVEFRVGRSDGAPGKSAIEEIESGQFDDGISGPGKLGSDPVDIRECYAGSTGVIVDPFVMPKATTGTVTPGEDDLKGKPFFALRKIAQGLNIDTTAIKGNDVLKAAIREARMATA